MPSSKDKRAQRHQAQLKSQQGRAEKGTRNVEFVADSGYKEVQYIGNKKYYTPMSSNPNTSTDAGIPGGNTVILSGGSGSNNNLILSDESVLGRHIRNATITFDKLAFETIGADQIASLSIGASHIENNSITATQIGSNVITATEIASNTITASEIGSNVITATEIANNTITANEIADNAITANAIGSNAVTSGSIASNAVTSGKIADGAITAGKIGNLEITAGKIANLTITASQLANLTINGAKIADHGIDGTDKIVANSITASAIASDTITASQIAAGSITASEMNVTSLSALSANMGSITSGDINVGSGKFILESDGDAKFSDGRFFFDKAGDFYIKPLASDASGNTRRGLVYTEYLDGSGNWSDYWMQYHDSGTSTDTNQMNLLYNGSNKFTLSTAGLGSFASGIRFGDISNNDIGFDQDGGNSISVQMNVNGSAMMPAVHGSSTTVGYDLGKSTQKWRKLYVVQSNVGDLVMDNQSDARWILREQPDCILARNCKTQKTFKLDMTETSDYNDELWEDEQ
tara:strand:- start:1117 stop:2688 length:1572 start_codon:yes stop_codon:yes gene_type:complete